jgi:S1-C subfamily serine protease
MLMKCHAHVDAWKALAGVLISSSVLLSSVGEGCGEVTSIGTGFAISFDGVVVTNEHVVEGCRSLRARSQGIPSSYYEVKVIARDQSADLAALRLGEQVSANGRRPFKPVPRAILREAANVQLGESVVTYGFPMRGLLASSGNLTSGNVTALRGLGDDPRYLQISTPVQPGNSGGALLDEGGNVVGVVAAKLNALAVMRSTGDVPQNVNFAINLSVLKRFLEQNGISAVAEQATAPRSLKDIGGRAQLFTYLIECGGT